MPPAVTQPDHPLLSMCRFVYFTGGVLGGSAGRRGDLGSQRRADAEKHRECGNTKRAAAVPHLSLDRELVGSGATPKSDGFSTVFLLGLIGFADIM